MDNCYFFNNINANIKKIIISIFFGLIGFLINFLSITIYDYEGIRIDILLGLLFPLIISIGWGWKYGLLSALFGGCQTMWFLWYTDGYGMLYSVPIFTVWIIFHGFLSDLNKTKENKKWYYNKYVAEVYFRIVATIGFFTIFIFLVSLNPPFWNDEIITNTVSSDWLKLVIVKHIVESYLLLLLADLFLRLNFIRKLLKIKERSRDTGYIIVYSLISGVFIWIIDSIMLTYFNTIPGNDFLDNFIFDIKPHDLLLRLIIFLIFAILGILFSNLIEKRNKGKIELEKQYGRITSILKLTSNIEKAKSIEEKEFMSDLLTTAMEIIPEADFGTAHIYQDEFAISVAVSGHDDSIINKKYKYVSEPDISKEAYIIKNFKKYLLENLDNKKIDKKTKDIGEKSLKEDKETMIVTLSLKERNIASITLGIDKDSIKSFSKESLELARLLKNIPSAFYTLIRDYELKQILHKNMITAIIKILSLHNPYTNEHSINVAKVSVQIAEKMGITDEEVNNVYWSAMVHDIGKILIPEEILDKKGKLTEAEYEIVKKHPVWGYETLNTDKSLNKLAKNVLHHHERWDGKGYPQGLARKDIPLISRIIAIADTYDAMTSDRPYRKAICKELVLQEIKNNSGTQFDPEIVEIFINNVL